MTTSLPPMALWEQFEVIGIIVLVVGLLFAAAWKVFREYQTWQASESAAQRKWQETQTLEQRAWQSEQNKIRDAEQFKRDALWQEQVRVINADHVDQDRLTASILARMIERMDALTMTLTMHDERIRDFIKDNKKGQ